MSEVSKSVKDQMERLMQQPFYKWFLQDNNGVDSDDEMACKLAWEACEEWVKQGQEPMAWLHRMIYETGDSNDRVSLSPVHNFGTTGYKITTTLLYTHPSPQPCVAELVEAARFLLNEVGHLGNASPVSLTKLEQALAKLEGKK